ncbi:MAG: hypothetical protein AAGD92_00630 [Pseudomonadota bacterium]
MPRFLIETGRRLKTSSSGGPVSARLSTWVGIISASIGGFLGLTTYSEDVAKKVDQSVEKTFDMIHAFNEPTLSEARLRVLSYVKARRLCDARVFYRELTEDDFVRVLDFFDLVNACVDAQLCDRTTAERFFSPYANYQWPILKNKADELRSGEQSIRADTAFGEGMEALAIAPTPAPPCDGNF